MPDELNSLFDDEQGQVVDGQDLEGGAGEAEPEEETLEDQEGDLESGDDGEPAPQPPEINHQFAELRKKSEAEILRLTREIDQKDQLAAKIFEKTVKGEVNPFTGKPIETIEDFEAWAEASEKDALERAGLSPDYIEQIINNNPVIRQAAAIIEQNQKMQGKMAFDRELSEIQKINPKIRSIDDLIGEMKDNEEFNAMVAGKMPLSRAYAAAHRIPQKKTDGSKDHLQSVGGGVGGDATEPPTDVLQTYLSMGFTKDEAVKHWRKEHRNG